PVDQVGKPRPQRYSAAEVKVGVPYAVALSSPAGVWACLIGSVVCFEHVDPPLLRLVETRMLWEPAPPPEPLPVQLAVSARPLPCWFPVARFFVPNSAMKVLKGRVGRAHGALGANLAWHTPWRSDFVSLGGHP